MSANACAIADFRNGQVPDDGDEGSEVIGYAGTLITVFWTAYDTGTEIDGIEHAGLTLDADDLSESMKRSLLASLRAKWDREAA